MNDYRDVKLGGKLLKKIYIAIMLWFMGRAIQAAAKIDVKVKKEFDELPQLFTFALGVHPDGPQMIVGKDINGKVKYKGWSRKNKKINVDMRIKNIEAAFMLFTFQESTPIASCRDRIIVDGDIPNAFAVVRIMDIVQVYLLPKLIAKLAIKRYPAIPFVEKIVGRAKIYLHTILGY